MNQEQGSPAGQLSGTDWRKVGKGALISIAGVGLAAAGLEACHQLQLISDQIDFGAYEAISVVVFSTLINGLRKWLSDTQKPA